MRDKQGQRKYTSAELKEMSLKAGISVPRSIVVEKLEQEIARLRSLLREAKEEYLCDVIHHNTEEFESFRDRIKVVLGEGKDTK